MKAQNSKVFLKGTAILTISGMIVKVIGSLNWVFLSRILGGEGIGLYLMGFPIYLLALTLSSAGLPLAISILTAEKIAQDDYIGAKRIFDVSKRFLFITGFVFMLIMFLSAHLLVDKEYIRDPRAYFSIIALAPAVFIVTYMSSMRGYLQGWQKMAPTALSEIVEQLFRVATMILLAWLFLPYGLEYGAAGASFGAAVGALMALIVLILCTRQLHKVFRIKFVKTQTQRQDTNKQILKRLLKLALPISMSSLMLPIVANFDMLIVPRRLEVAGFDIHKSTELFGYLTGMAIPLINLATIITAALSIALVPSIASSRSQDNYIAVKDKTATAFRIAVAVTIPASVATYLLSTSLASIVYNSPLAAPIIQISSIAIFFLGLHQVSTGILQGLGHTKIPFISMIFAAIVKIYLNWLLVADPAFGILGASWSTIADMALAAMINLYFINKYTKYTLQLKVIAKVILASAFMALAINISLMLDKYLGSWHLLIAVIFGIITYMLVILSIKALPDQDIQQIPLVGNICQKIVNKIIYRNMI